MKRLFIILFLGLGSCEILVPCPEPPDTYYAVIERGSEEDPIFLRTMLIKKGSPFIFVRDPYNIPELRTDIKYITREDLDASDAEIVLLEINVRTKINIE